MDSDVEEAAEYLGLNLEREAWAAGRDLQLTPVKHIPLPSPSPERMISPRATVSL